MKLSTRVRYGLRLLIGFAIRYNQGFIQLSEVANAEGISEKYAEQIVRILKMNGLLISQRGSQGGYMLALPPERITVLNLFEVMEGKFSLIDCLSKNECERISGCVARGVWKKLEDAMVSTLNSITLGSLAKEYAKMEIKAITYHI